MKPDAKIEICAGVTNDGDEGHAMRDFCSTCAPWWREVMTCPTHGTKLPRSGWCKACRRYYWVGNSRHDGSKVMSQE